MTNPRNILNKFKWKKDLNLKKVEVWYLHRGAPKDTKIVTGDEIVDIGISFMKTNQAMIPFHRVYKIKYENKIIYKRKKK